MKEYKCNAPSSKKCLCNNNGYCHTLENCMYQYDESHDNAIKKIVDLLYQFNVHSIIKIEELAELILSNIKED